MSTDSENVKPTVIDLDAETVVEDGAPAEQAATAAPLRREGSSMRRPLVSLLALAIAAVAGGWAYRDVLSDYYPTPRMQSVVQQAGKLEASNAALTEQVATLGRLTDQLKSDVDALEANAAQAATSTNDGLTAAQGRLASAESAIADLKSSMAGMQVPAQPAQGTAPTADPAALNALTARVEALEKDLASLKQQGGAPSAVSAPLVQALADIKAKIAAGQPFASELERIVRLVPAAPGSVEMQAYAQAGLPNAQGLADELSALVPTLPTREERTLAAEDDTVLGRIWSSLSGLIVIRYQGEADWPRAAEAAAALAASGDIPQAIDTLNKPEGAKPPGIQQWLEKAAARLKVEQNLLALDAAVQRVLAAKG